MRFLIILFVLYQIESSDTQFNLYHTDKHSLMTKYGYDCFYYHELTTHSTSFCIRPQEANNENRRLCYGIPTTFKQLKMTNISIINLTHWNAVIEVIDLYEKYLLYPNLVNDNEIYCNCSRLTRFGKFCQYEIDVKANERNFQELNSKMSSSLLDVNFDKIDMPCYIGLQCQRNFDCFDWRQICNGIIDCDHGEDEIDEFCLEMERNQCDSDKEYRCGNGQCLPLSMLSYDWNACPDLSDHQHANKILSKKDECSSNRPSYSCRNTNLAWKQFSCLNGQSISYSDLTSIVACQNNYHLTFLRKLFSSNNEKIQCWKTMICLTGFNYLYSQINCSNEINLTKSCSKQFYFPFNSIVYSFVYFLYDQTNRSNWLNYSGPNYICYKKEYCLNYTLSLSTFFKDNLTCFSIDEKMFSWKNFYEYILVLFHRCFSKSNRMFNDRMLFQCNQSQSLISIYRVRNKIKDCFFNEDEDKNVDVCLLKRDNIFKCLSNPNECIQELLLGDNQFDCTDGSDEYFTFASTVSCVIPYCGFRPWIKRTLPEIYPFDELCDNIVNRHLFSFESNETDETDCEHWPLSCDSYYTKCDHIWNCRNGIDELNCPYKFNGHFSGHIRAALACKSNEHYCIQLIDHNLVNGNCIKLNRTDDGIIDCIGGTDERFDSICIKNYPTEFQRRFQCLNSSFCIRSDQVCDRIKDCPFNDDELICPWLLQSNSSAFYCQKSSEVPFSRCLVNVLEDRKYCPMRENLWFCDIGINKEAGLYVHYLDPESEIDSMIHSVSFQLSNMNQIFESEKQSLLSINTNVHPILCSFGYPIKSSVFENQTHCLCPLHYYGDHCQYQSNYLDVFFTITYRYSMNSLTIFRLIIYLLNENHFVISYEQFLYTKTSSDIFIYSLIGERITNLTLHQQSKSKFIRIDSYIINKTNVKYICSWFFHVSFPFLPINRVFVELRLVNESFQVIYCKKRCGSHGKCFHYVNAKDKEYCWCEQGWFGEYCQLKSSSCHSTSCSPYSQCLILNENKKQIQCICPLGIQGDQCYIRHKACFSNPCPNNTFCIPLDEKRFDCICIRHDGSQSTDCSIANSNTYVFISISDNITQISTIPLLAVLFHNVDENTINANIQHLYENIRLPTTLKIKNLFGELVIVRIFSTISKSSYYMVSENDWITSSSSVNISVTSENVCPHVNEIFNETILNEYSYLKRLKLYHLPCQNNHNLRCFVDEYRLCICTKNHNSHCNFYNHEYGFCNSCRNNGLCVNEGLDSPWNFLCLCPKCTYGTLCQFTPRTYLINLDILIGLDIKTEETSISQQPLIIQMTLTCFVILLIVSLIFNTISILVFSNSKFRQVGCDFYLLIVAIVCEIGLILLFTRLIFLLIIQLYIFDNYLFVGISCILFEYFLRLIPPLFDWLTVCISIERAYTITKDIQFTRVKALKTLRLSRWISLIVFILNVVLTSHRPFYLKLFDELTINDEYRGHPWCILDFGSSSWDVYEKCLNVSQVVLPYVLNLLAILVFLLNKTKLEFTSTAKQVQSRRLLIMEKQFRKYKAMMLSPTIVLILEIPRFVLTFTASCIENDWQRYIYLAVYLISFLPLTGILFIYILPSPKYRKELQRILKDKFHITIFERL